MTTALRDVPAKSSFAIFEVADVSNLDLSLLEIYSCYQTMQFCHAEVKEALFRQELVEAVEAGGFCMAITISSEVVAVCAIKPLHWDSAHFGIGMAQLLLAASSRSCLRDALSQMLMLSVNKAKRSLGICHVSIEMSIDHYHCINPVLALGFEIMNVKRYYNASDVGRIKKPRFLSLVRDYQESDRDVVMNLIEPVEIESRFTRDGILSAVKVREMYRIWLSRSLEQRGSGSIALVFERHGSVEACGVISRKSFPYLEKPVEFMDKGLYVSNRKGVGGFSPVLYELMSRSVERYGAVQTCTSLNNGAAAKIIEGLNSRLSVSAYCLRLYLG